MHTARVNPPDTETLLGWESIFTTSEALQSQQTELLQRETGSDSYTQHWRTNTIQTRCVSLKCMLLSVYPTQLRKMLKTAGDLQKTNKKPPKRNTQLNFRISYRKTVHTCTLSCWGLCSGAYHPCCTSPGHWLHPPASCSPGYCGLSLRNCHSHQFLHPSNVKQELKKSHWYFWPF